MIDIDNLAKDLITPKPAQQSTTGVPILDRIIDMFPEDRRPSILEILGGQRPASQLANVFRSHGIQVSASSIRNYRQSLDAKVCNRDF